MDQDQKKMRKFVLEVIEAAEEPLSLTNKEEAAISPYLKFLKGLLELDLGVQGENRILLTRYLCILKGFTPNELRTKKLHFSLNRAIRYLLFQGGV